MKKICLVFLFALLTLSTNAQELSEQDLNIILENAWGCEALSQEETTKAQNILNSASEIINLDGPIALEDIKFEHGLILSSKQISSVQDYYVKLNNQTDFINLGILVGCQVTNNDLPYKTKDKILSIEDRINNIEKELAKCENITRENSLTPYQSKIDCIKQVAYKFFENFSINKHQTLKDNFDNYLSSYEKIYKDMNYNIGKCKNFSGSEQNEAISKEMVVITRNLITNYIKSLKNCIQLETKRIN